MIRHLIAGTAAVMLLATPAIAFAADAASTTYSDTKPKKAAKAHTAKPHKAKAKKAAAPAK